jgi:penicillin V acylase-like amidase (Ntn superfamily)
VSASFFIFWVLWNSREDAARWETENTRLRFIRHADKGIYYYTTYENRQITAIDMQKEDLEGNQLIKFPLVQGEQIKMQN